MRIVIYLLTNSLLLVYILDYKILDIEIFKDC